MKSPESRDFATAAGKLSVAEKMATNPQMHAQVSALAKALSEANEEVAVRAGVGDVYRKAIREYRTVMKIRGVKDKTGELAEKYALHALGAGAVGAAVYDAIKK